MGLNADAAVTDLMSTLRPSVPLIPRNARRISTASPEDVALPTREETTMPRGVYDRTKKAEGGGDAPKLKRKYQRRAKNGEGADVATLAREAFDDAARHLFATVKEQVEFDENEDLVRALRSFEIADKIVKAAG